MNAIAFVQRDSVADLAPSLVSTEPANGSSLAHVLIRLGRQDASGVVFVKRDDGVEATLAIAGGVLQRLTLTGTDDDTLLFEHLRADGVDAARLDAARATARLDRKPLSVTVFRAGLATVQDIARLLRLGRLDVVKRCLAPGQGHVSFTPRDDIPRDAITLPLAPVLFAHYRERLADVTLKDIEARLGNLIFRFPLATFETAIFAKGAENDLVDQYCTGNLNTRTVIDKGSLGSVRGARLMLLLFAFELLDVRLEPLRITQNLDVKEAVEARLPAVNAGNPFDVLDVHWSAHPREIETKYRDEVQRFDAFLQRSGLGDDLAGDVKLVRLALDQAWRVLVDPHRRREFRAHNYTHQQIAFAASFLHQQAELAVFRRDERTARRQLEAAIDLSDDPRYVEALATLRERVSGEQPQAEVKRPTR